MKLTAYSNYAMRVLMVAASRSPGLSTIREVATGFGISEALLVKSVHQLGTWGYLETVRGNKGGFRLAMPAGEIRIGEVIRRTEDGFAVVECLKPETNTCPLIGHCRLSEALGRATAAFLAVLDDLTLADIADNGTDLMRILALPVPAAAAPLACAITP